MCGISVQVSTKEHWTPSEELAGLLRDRGPDEVNMLQFQAGDFYLTFYSTVLALRGLQIKQPLQTHYPNTDCQSTLCWNGEAWSVAGQCTYEFGNDAMRVQHLLHAVASKHRQQSTRKDYARALCQIAGPYAFVFYEHETKCLYFGRDFLGRRSLLQRIFIVPDVPGAMGFSLSSLAEQGAAADDEDLYNPPWEEVKADGIYRLDLERSTPGGRFDITHVPYIFMDDAEDGSVSVLPRLSICRNPPDVPSVLSFNSHAITELHDRLQGSVALRLADIPEPPRQEYPQNNTRAKLAILFSGGLDCTVLARLAHTMTPPDEWIDLLNVAFENPRVHGSEHSPYETCPDRISARNSYAELQQVCRGRKWRLITIDIPYDEYKQHLPEIVRLMFPHDTEMDLSIASALYFASRGSGHTTLGHEYSTSAKVLFSGLGADELFAGYGKHATVFGQYGFNGLLDQLQIAVSGLSQRNLGRDDRVLSSWGREVRYPYLDEFVIGWAMKATVNQKCGFGESDAAIEAADASASLPPDKKVLRCLAWKLGMYNVAKEKKRAIQFGARTAKMTSGKTRGTQKIS